MLSRMLLYRRWNADVSRVDILRLLWDDEEEDGTWRLAGVDAVLGGGWLRVRRRAGSADVSCKGRVDCDE